MKPRQALANLLLAALPAGVPVLAQIPVGSAHQVNPEHAQNQQTPSLGLDQRGESLVVYAGDNLGNKKARALDDRGVPRGAELHLSGEFGYALGQSVSLTRQGAGAVCFAAGGPCLCRLIDTRAASFSREIRCSERAIGIHESEDTPQVATFEDASFVVSWTFDHSGSEPPAEIYDVYARFFDAGGEPLGPPILVARDLRDPPLASAVAALAGGEAVVVWYGLGLDGDGRGIRGRRLSRTGLLGPEFPVNTYTAGDQLRPAIASNLGDRFVVVWESVGQAGVYGDIFGQRFDGAGNKLGSEVRISGDAPSDRAFPVVAMDRSTRFSAAYFGFTEDPEGSQDVYFRSFDGAGLPLGPPQPAHVLDSRAQEYPAIAQADNGLIQLAWQDFGAKPDDPELNYDVMTRRFVLPCVPDANTLCLGQGRFAARAFWRDPAGREELARQIPLASDTGGFYFFDPTNFELLVKVLDGCAINQHFWVFAAGLTDVEVDLLVTDTHTGEVHSFHNDPAHAFQPVQQLGLFGGCGAAAPAEPPALAQAAPREAEAAGACPGDPTALCLGGGRYRATARWANFTGQAGPATAFPQSERSGLFYFFDPGNLELAVKVLDGCALNGKQWVFAAGLTDVEVTLKVEDTATGAVWERHHGAGTPFPPLFDTAAFGCP